MANTDDLWVFPMIEAVRSRPTLWRADAKDFKSATSRLSAWTSVVEEVENVTGIIKSVKDVKRRWETVRDAYVSKKRRRPTGSAAGNENKSKYAEVLSFLDTRGRIQTSASNFPLPPGTQILAYSPNSRADQVGNDSLSPGHVSTGDSEGDEEELVDAAAITGEHRYATPFDVRKRRRTNGGSLSDFEQRVLGILERGKAKTANGKRTNGRSGYQEYGDRVGYVLDRLPNEIRGAALREILGWLSRYEVEIDSN